MQGRSKKEAKQVTAAAVLENLLVTIPMDTFLQSAKKVGLVPASPALSFSYPCTHHKHACAGTAAASHSGRLKSARDRVTILAGFRVSTCEESKAVWLCRCLLGCRASWGQGGSDCGAGEEEADQHPWVAIKDWSTCRLSMTIQGASPTPSISHLEIHHLHFSRHRSYSILCPLPK